ncbi:MAG: 4-carboxymuconolactone decarboxylase [Gammaproteobacteria bacterium]|nr:4-carboxymuconolactone decarboxylase [Gammaproteobacteria bacterium]
MTTAKFDAGLAVRKAVLGKAYVERALADADDFTEALQELVTENAWGTVWTRDGLTRRERSMLTVVMLIALNRPHELKLHLHGALTNGVTKIEIREMFLHAAVYCGMPAAVDAFRTAKEVFKELEGKA